jgi:hypothetical protein
MAKYPSTNILITGREMDNLNSLQGYFEIIGTSFYQSSYELFKDRTDFIYFLGDSSVFLKRFKTKADIKICSLDEEKLSNLKNTIEEIISGIDTNPIST